MCVLDVMSFSICSLQSSRLSVCYILDATGLSKAFIATDSKPVGGGASIIQF